MVVMANFAEISAEKAEGKAQLESQSGQDALHVQEATSNAICDDVTARCYACHDASTVT